MKLLLTPFALVAYAVYVWPRSLLGSTAARRRLRAGKVTVFSSLLT